MGVVADFQHRSASDVQIRDLGVCDYQQVAQQMQQFTDNRNADTADELWCLQHPRVFTLGQAGDPAHVLAPGDIPLVQSNRGGQVTYHGPGQLVIYTLIDLRRCGMGVRSLVTLLETAVIELLADHDVEAVARADAPGVYVAGSKIAALGLRVRRGCSFHGLSLNVDMDLEPFLRINPCGYRDLSVTQLTDVGVDLDIRQAASRICSILQRELSNRR